MSKSGQRENYDVVVLAGGGARRLGGVDKTQLTVGGRPMLDRVLDAARGARQVIVVGPERSTTAGRPIRWALEEPPGGGPLAGLAAALELDECSSPVVVALAADMPLVDRRLVERLVEATAAPETDAVALCDAEGQVQPLAAAYRREALATVLDEIGDPQNLGFRPLLSRLRIDIVTDARAATDCDTPEDLRRLENMMLTDWTERLAAELGLDPSDPGVELDTILNLARDAAHAVERPAAPVTAFYVGYAAAKRGGGDDAIAECVRIARELTAEWERDAAS
jgi:molybdopterin-guanine dinucleotide biosynthesis protein A